MDVEILTFGCRLNTVETEVIRREAKAAGIAETIVINTCAVTAEAVRQARQAIRKARRENGGARIVVTGCAAQTEPETFAPSRSAVALASLRVIFSRVPVKTTVLPANAAAEAVGAASGSVLTSSSSARTAASLCGSEKNWISESVATGPISPSSANRR